MNDFQLLEFIAKQTNTNDYRSHLLEILDKLKTSQLHISLLNEMLDESRKEADQLKLKVKLYENQ